MRQAGSLASGVSTRRASSACECSRRLPAREFVTVPIRPLAARARSLAAHLDGTLVPAVPVPRRATGRMHAEAQRTYAVWMAGQPVSGVAVWAHTGRGLHLDAETRHEVLASWRAALSPSSVIIAGCGVPATDSTL